MHRILGILFHLFVLGIQAQNVQVLSELTKEPIPGVAVFNSEKTKTTISDLDGKVVLNQFAEERITFQHISFERHTILKSKIGEIIFLRPKSQDLDEVVVSASKFEQSKKEVPQRIISIKSEDIVFSNPQTSADLLQNSGQIFIQKSQLGGGSPMIRGFSTNRLSLSIDGVRMNNAIFRGGNVQSVISIDPFSIQNTEVILGAGSVIYGSDAIGGVMNFYTKKPVLSTSDSLLVNGKGTLRYASASNEQTGSFQLNFGKKKWAFLTTVSYTKFDDLKMGKNGSLDYLRPEFVITRNGEDEIVPNKDPRTQKFTGYDQTNFLQKIRYKSNENVHFDLGLYYSETSDYPRYDRLIRYEDQQLRSAEWNYGPQKWFLGNFQLTKLSSRSTFYDKIKLTAAYQNFQESRIDRNLFSEDRHIRKENVDAISLNFDFENSVSDRSKVYYGAEYIFNSVGSNGQRQNINTNTIDAIASRYPDGSSWQSFAAYLSYKYKPNKKFTFQSGIRYNHVVINANLNKNNRFYNLPFDNADLNTGAFTGTAGVSWNTSDRMQWKLNATTAFRAPNIDDVGKVFDSEPGSVVVPNSDLEPEYAYGAELGLALKLASNINLDLGTYYTYLDNALVRRNYSINGETEILYDGVMSNVQAIQNASKANIHGFEVGLHINFTDQLELRSQYSIVSGTEEDNSGAEVPVRHVAPDFGNTHLIWTKSDWKLDTFLIYNAELSNNDLSPTLASYLFAQDKNGNPYSPSWYTLNVRGQYQVSPSLLIIATLENITNQLYRPYASGIAGAGINAIFALNYEL